MWNIIDSGKFDKDNIKSFVYCGSPPLRAASPYYSSKDDIALVFLVPLWKQGSSTWHKQQKQVLSCWSFQYYNFIIQNKISYHTEFVDREII